MKRPLVEHHGWRQRPPVEPSRRDRAILLADVLAHREVEVVALQARAGLARELPELSEPGIEVDVCLFANSLQERFDREMPTHVHEQVRLLRELVKLREIESARPRALAADERSRASEAELLHERTTHCEF